MRTLMLARGRCAPLVLQPHLFQDRSESGVRAKAVPDRMDLEKITRVESSQSEAGSASMLFLQTFECTLALIRECVHQEAQAEGTPLARPCDLQFQQLPRTSLEAGAFLSLSKRRLDLWWNTSIQ